MAYPLHIAQLPSGSMYEFGWEAWVMDYATHQILIYKIHNTPSN